MFSLVFVEKLGEKPVNDSQTGLKKESLLSIQQLMESLSHQHVPTSTLYVIATPIGNIGDISLRALHILGVADLIACEDTRTSRQLLSGYGLSSELVSAHKHNEREAAGYLIERLKKGERIALVSDAGTPAVSDPGARIVDAVREAGLNVVPVPGSSAAITALSASGLLDDHFLFYGFLPTKNTQRKDLLKTLTDTRATLIFYEAPHRIEETLNALADVFEPERRIVIARELTKLFEEIHRCTMAEVMDWFKSDPNHKKGEFVLLVEGAQPVSDDINTESQRVLSILMQELPVSTAASLTAKITGNKKNHLYELALQLKQEK